MSYPAKGPKKSILKSSSFDGRGQGNPEQEVEEKVSSPPPTCTTKQATFDEVNILQTYHPPDKEYGHIPAPKEERIPFMEEELVQVLPELKSDRLKEGDAVKLGRKLLEEEEEEGEEEASG